MLHTNQLLKGIFLVNFSLYSLIWQCLCHIALRPKHRYGNVQIKIVIDMYIFLQNTKKKFKKHKGHPLRFSYLSNYFFGN